MVELRKRKEAPPPPVQTKKAKKAAAGKAKKAEPEKTIIETVTDAVTDAVEGVKEAVTGSNGAASAAGGPPRVGDTVDLTTFGGEIETHDGTKTTLGKLVDEHGNLVIFSYPKASTPGCTTQACLFRDSYKFIHEAGYSVFGLSSDSPKANTTFKTKQNLPYTLLCDPAQTLISAIGFKKAPKGTTRGVFVVDKTGKVLALEPGGPTATLEVVKKLIEGDTSAGPTAVESKLEDDKEAAKTAAEVADTAAKVDSK